MGFLIMGVIGYVVKLSTCSPQEHPWDYTDAPAVHIPVNNILVGGA